jgi:hypothetical protein
MFSHWVLVYVEDDEFNLNSKIRTVFHLRKGDIAKGEKQAEFESYSVPLHWLAAGGSVLE